MGEHASILSNEYTRCAQEDGDRPGEAVGVACAQHHGNIQLSYGLYGYGTEHPIMVGQGAVDIHCKSLDHRS